MNNARNWYTRKERARHMMQWLPQLGIIVTQAAFLFALSLLAAPVAESTSALIFFLPSIVLCSWYWGRYAGTFMAVAGSVAYIAAAAALDEKTPLELLLPALLYSVNGALVSIFLDYMKQSTENGYYRSRSQELAERLEATEMEYAKAKEEIRLRDEFLSITSHELKTPLTSMLLHIQSALHNLRSVSLANFSIERLMHMLESTQNQTKRMSKMINDLLNVSMMTTGRLHLEREESNLEEVVKEVVAGFSARLEKEGYQLLIKTEPAIGEWDALRLEQAITNLVSNAIKYGARKPIEIDVLKNHHVARFIIRDHGIGIAADDQDRVFRLFQRGVSPQDYTGLGVGLYITQRIIDAHGGAIQLKSQQGHGTTFTVELPLKAQPAN